jgi:hypothetical protein
MKPMIQRSRRMGLLATLALAAYGGGDGSATESEADLVARAQQIHDRVITIDTHNDINAANFTAEKNYTMELGNQVDLPKMEAGGLDPSWMVGSWERVSSRPRDSTTLPSRST